MSKRLYAGTSGWAYPTWKPDFYPAGTPAKRFLEFYASKLTSVEVNYTFRALPTAKMLEGWLAATPPNFRFSFKAPQRITHFKRLQDCANDVAQFVAALHRAELAGNPPAGRGASPLTRWDEPARAALAALEGVIDTGAAAAAWDAALCIAESDDLLTPEVHTAADCACYRLRRSGGYSAVELDAFAKRFTALAEQRDVYVYFKHEDEPTGALNATAFLERAVAEGR